MDPLRGIIYGYEHPSSLVEFESLQEILDWISERPGETNVKLVRELVLTGYAPFAVYRAEQEKKYRPNRWWPENKKWIHGRFVVFKEDEKATPINLDLPTEISVVLMCNKMFEKTWESPLPDWSMP